MLRIGYIPEHFSAPLVLAVKHSLLKASLVPVPAGSGALIGALQAGEIDACMGLTEAFVAKPGDYQIDSIYVQSPLRWAVTTKPNTALPRDHLRVGISRFGSGSHRMSSLLAKKYQLAMDQLEFKPLETFANLRKGVLQGEIDVFLWEYFTTNRYAHEVQIVDEIPTPWPSWVAVSSKRLAADKRREFLSGLDAGLAYYRAHPDEARRLILDEFDYTDEDQIRQWQREVQFAEHMSTPLSQDLIDEIIFHM